MKIDESAVTAPTFTLDSLESLGIAWESELLDNTNATYLSVVTPSGWSSYRIISAAGASTAQQEPDAS